MTSRLIKNTAIYTIGSVLPQAVNFIMLPIYTRYITTTELGIVNSMLVLQTILILLFTLGTERSIYRLYHDYKTEEERRIFLGTITIAVFIVSSIFLALLYPLQSSISSIFKSIPFHPFYFLTIIISYLSVFLNIPNIIFIIEEKASKFVIVNFIQFCLNAIWIIIFVVFLREGAIGILKANLYSILLILPYYLLSSYNAIKIAFKWQIFISSLKFSIPMIPATISAWVLNFTDRIFIERYFNLSDVGIYSLGTRISSAILILTSAFFKAFNPHFYKIANADDKENAHKMLYRDIHLFNSVNLILCFIIALFSKELVQILFDSHYEEAFFIIPIISLAYFISQGNGILNLYYYQQKKTTLVMVFILITAVINICSNFLLVQKYSMYGAAISALISYTFMFTLQYCFAHKYFFIPFNWKWLSSSLLFSIFCVYILNYVLIIDSILLSILVKTLLVFLYTSVFVYFNRTVLKAIMPKIIVDYFLNIKRMLGIIK